MWLHKLKHSLSLKRCYSKQLFFPLVFILGRIVRFLLNLINQYYSLLTAKFIYMLKAFQTKTGRFKQVQTRLYLANVRGLGQCLKWHHHQIPNKSSAAVVLTKNKQKIITDHNICRWWCHYLHVTLSPLCCSLTLILVPWYTPVPPLLHSGSIFEWPLIECKPLTAHQSLKF